MRIATKTFSVSSGRCIRPPQMISVFLNLRLNLEKIIKRPWSRITSFCTHSDPSQDPPQVPSTVCDLATCWTPWSRILNSRIAYGPLGKRSGGLRPIACGLTLRRLAAKIAVRRGNPNSSQTLLPSQVGCAVRGGAEATVHATRIFLKGTPYVKINFLFICLICSSALLLYVHRFSVQNSHQKCFFSGAKFGNQCRFAHGAAMVS